jgi:cell division GTPase FtsZ
MEGEISPLIIIDNERISNMYPGLVLKSFWPTINNIVAGLFDIFNRLSALSSQYTAFDPGDYRSIRKSGGCAIMGLTKVEELKDKFAISKAVKDNLEKTLLAGEFDLSSAQEVGCAIMGGNELMANVKGLQQKINYAFDILSDMTGQATVHRGIYEDSKDSIRVYTIMGGLNIPTARFEDFKG